jgi:hypothetical protein
MTNPHKTLHDRLTTLGKVPEGLHKGIVSDWRDTIHRPITRMNALAILRDAARRVCDWEGRGLFHIFAPATPPRDMGEYVVEWFVDDDGDLFDEDDTPTSVFPDYESALIAGLDYLIEQREAAFDTAHTELDEQFGDAMRRLAEAGYPISSLRTAKVE